MATSTAKLRNRSGGTAGSHFLIFRMAARRATHGAKAAALADASTSSKLLLLLGDHLLVQIGATVGRRPSNLLALARSCRRLRSALEPLLHTLATNRWRSCDVDIPKRCSSPLPCCCHSAATLPSSAATLLPSFPCVRRSPNGGMGGRAG